MKRPDDYPQQSRFYTGLYSFKAYSAIKDAVMEHCNMWGVDTVRAFDKEVVVACSAAVIYHVGGWRGITPDFIKKTVARCLKSEETSGNPEKESIALTLRLFFEGGAMTGQQAKMLEKMRGKRSNDVAAEVACCEEEEERKVKAEHDAFMKKILEREFVSPRQITGQYGRAPYWMDKQAAFPGPVDRAELEKYFRLESEMLALNNLLAKTFKAYSDKFLEFNEARKALRRLNSEMKARRVKEVKAEFRLAKRAV